MSPLSMPRLSTHLDHLVLAVSELDAGAASLADRLGIDIAAGGRHEGFGTHNAVFGIGGGAYLEVIAVDPSQEGGPLAAAVGRPDAPELMSWAARVDDAGAVAAAAERHGLRSRVVPMSRATTTGELLRWKIVVVGGHAHEGAFPFFIDWIDTPHPADRLPPGAALEHFEVGTRDAGHLGELLRAFGVDVAVQRAPEPRLRATVTGPGGRVEMVGPARGLMQALL